MQFSKVLDHLGSCGIKVWEGNEVGGGLVTSMSVVVKHTAAPVGRSEDVFVLVVLVGGIDDHSTLVKVASTAADVFPTLVCKKNVVIILVLLSLSRIVDS